MKTRVIGALVIIVVLFFVAFITGTFDSAPSNKNNVPAQADTFSDNAYRNVGR